MSVVYISIHNFCRLVRPGPNCLRLDMFALRVSGRFAHVWRQIGDKIETYISRRRIRRFVVILSSYSSFHRNLVVVFLILS